MAVDGGPFWSGVKVLSLFLLTAVTTDKNYTVNTTDSGDQNVTDIFATQPAESGSTAATPSSRITEESVQPNQPKQSAEPLPVSGRLLAPVTEGWCKRAKQLSWKLIFHSGYK